MQGNGEGFRPQKWDPEELARLVKLECETMGKSPEQLANDKLIENVAFAVDSIVWLAMYSDTETTRFTAAKYIVEQVIGKADTMGVAAEKTDVFERIMQGVVMQTDN